MERKKSKYNPSNISVWKRIGGYFADLVIFMILAITLYSFAIYPLTKAITPYDKYSNTRNEAYDNAETILLDAKIIFLDENNKEIELEKTFVDDLTYFIDENFFDELGQYQEHFAYFYINYIPNEATFNGQKISRDINWVNKGVFQTENPDNIVFEAPIENQIALLKDDAKLALKDYLNGEENAETIKYYDYYINLMNNAWNEASDLIIQSDNYVHYVDIYSSYGDKILYIYSLSSIISFTIFFFLYYLLVPLLLKKGQTLSKKILHYGLFLQRNQPIDNKTLILRSILQYIFNFHFVIFIPIFQVGANFIIMPLMQIGNMTFYLFTFAVITFLLAIISFIYMFININHQSLHDRILGIYILNENPAIIDEKTGEPIVYEEDRQWK